MTSKWRSARELRGKGTRGPAAENKANWARRASEAEGASTSPGVIAGELGDIRGGMFNSPATRRGASREFLFLVCLVLFVVEA